MIFPFLHQPLKSHFPTGNFIGCIAVGFSGCDVFESFQGFEVGATAEVFQHEFSAFPSGEGALEAVDFFHFAEQIAGR